MANIVKYHNDINEISFKNFEETDLNFLMAICARMRDLGEETQKFSYSQIMDMMEWDKSKSINSFHKVLKRTVEKLRLLGATFDTDQECFRSFNLFSDFEGDKSSRVLTVRVNPRWKYILNDLTKNFTRFELSEYVKLTGRYTKLLYQHLKQYRKTGWWKISVEDMREKLAIPSSMPNMHIITKVVNPSVELIKKCKGFEDLTVTALRSDRRGRKVEGYKFEWTGEKQIPGQRSIDEYLDEKKRTQKKSRNKFNDYPQTEYDFDLLEKLIANH